jgi:hypothetical protein
MDLMKESLIRTLGLTDQGIDVCHVLGTGPSLFADPVFHDESIGIDDEGLGKLDHIVLAADLVTGIEKSW